MNDDNNDEFTCADNPEDYMTICRHTDGVTIEITEEEVDRMVTMSFDNVEKIIKHLQDILNEVKEMNDE